MWCDLYKAENKPSDEQIRDYIGTYLYDDLTDYFRETHLVKPMLVYSCSFDDGGSWKGWKYKNFEGWSIKYEKSGMPLCTLYPLPGYFVALIKLEEQELEEAYLMTQICHQYTKEVFEMANYDTEYKYVEIEVTNPDILEDVQNFVNLKMSQPMKFGIERKIENFYHNVQASRRRVKWVRLEVRHIAMMFYTIYGRQFDQKAIVDCYRIIMENNHIFSAFRGNRAMCLAAMLSLEENHADFLAKIVTVDGMMRSNETSNSDFIVMAAYLIVSQREPADYPDVVRRVKRFIKNVRRNFWYKINGEVYVYATLFALSSNDYESGIKRIKEYYNKLHSSFFYPDCVQAISHILALSADEDGLAERVIMTLGRNKAYKYRIWFSRIQTVPILGVLMLLPVEVSTLLNDVSDADLIIKNKKGFSSMLITKQQRHLYAASLVASTYIDEIKRGGMKIDDSLSLDSILLAQKVANIMAFMGCARVASAAKAGVEIAKPGGAPLRKYRKKAQRLDN